MSRVDLDQLGIKSLANDVGMKAMLGRVGAAVADDARAAAPRDTGAMADSIDYEVDEDDDGAYVNVSFDADHFYGAFSELGTSAQSPRPFLRPAVEKKRSL